MFFAARTGFGKHLSWSATKLLSTAAGTVRINATKTSGCSIQIRLLGCSLGQEACRQLQGVWGVSISPVFELNGLDLDHTRSGVKWRARRPRALS